MYSIIWYVLQYSSSVLAGYTEHCFHESTLLNEWTRVWCCESRNFAAGVALICSETPRFLCILGRGRTTPNSQSSFLGEIDGWLTCARRQKTFNGRAREFSSEKKKSKVEFKGHTIPSEQNIANFPALSTYERVYGGVFFFFFSLSVCPPCFSDNCASLLAQKLVV